MARRLLLIAVITPVISRRLRATGRESAVVVRGLGVGEELVLRIQQAVEQDPQIIALIEGENPLPSALERATEYEIEKVKGGESATTVEVILG